MRILGLALLLGSVILAEEQYFPQSRTTTWDEARDHCQTCFKDLATITSRNIHLILQNLNSEYWIGLRRRFSDFKAWSRWSNGDRVTYQNWYPGHPIPKRVTCSSTPTSTTRMTDSTSTTPLNNSTIPPETTSTSTTPVIDSTSPSMTDSTSTTPVIDSTSPSMTDSTSTTTVTDSTSTTPVIDSTSPSMTDSTSTTPVIDSTSPSMTDSTSTTTVTDSTSTTPVIDSTSPSVTDSTSTTTVTDSTSTIPVTDSTSTTPVTDSTSTTLLTDLISPPVTTPTSTTPVADLTSTTPVTDSTSTIPISLTTSQISTTEDQCSLLTQMLDCLNMSYFINKIVTMVSTTPHPLYHTLLPVSMPSSTQRICDDDDDTEEYIEDACVALLSNGMWEERLCNLNLSYICYEERFMGEIQISNPTETGASLSWSPAPGNITHYKVEIAADRNQTFKNILNETDLSAQLLDLKTGTQYDVHVIPVKCGRDLNPQNISFYTTPSAVYNLNVMKVTNESVELRWDHSEGYDFYSVNVSDVDSASTLVTDSTSTTPLTDSTGTSSLTNSTSINQVTDLTSTTPLTDSTSNTPMTDSSSITPVTDSTSITPVTDSTSTTPLTDSTGTSSLTDSTSINQVTDLTSTTPLTDSTSTTPLTLSTSSTTLTDSTSINPVTDSTSITPVTDSTSTSPLTDSTSTTPLTNSTSTTLLTGLTSNTPLTYSTSTTPLSDSTSTTPLTDSNSTTPLTNSTTLLTGLTSNTPLTYSTSTTPLTDSTSTIPLTDSNSTTPLTNSTTLLTGLTSNTPLTYLTSTTPLTDSTSISPVTVPNRTTPVTVLETHTANESKIVISGLTPAKLYHFTVTAMVNGTIESLPESISTYTKPSPVLNLKSADEYDTIINASWTKPNETLSGYRVCLNENILFSNYYSDCSECVNCTNTTAEWINFTGKTPDTKYILCVVALTNNNKVQGEMVQIDAYTRPSKVAHLTLSSTNQSITANWELTAGYKKFNLSIKADGRNSTSDVTDQSKFTFNKLDAAKSYTITVITLSEKSKLESDPAELSVYTKPSPVLNLTSADEYDTIINASWTKPNETLSGYRVCLNANNIFYNDYSDCNDCSECVNCIITTAEWIKFTGKTPDTKYILCVAALTNNNEVQGEMVQIDAYTRPSKVADLSLTSTFQSITANWLLPQSNKKFNVSIKADGWVGTSDFTNQLSYTFNKLQPAKSYTVTVITLSEKYKLKSDPAERSVYTTPSGVYNLRVIKVTNESVELSWDHSGEYDLFSVHVSDVSKLNNTNESTIVISGLTPGKSYHFTVFAIVNGTTESVPESVSTYTKPSPVLNLKSADEYDTIINASWTKPNENLSGYRVCLNENNIFCNDYSDCVECSEFVNCIITTAEWINFPDKTPGTKYILCVAALTNNNEVQGEMVKIDAYTRPSKVADLTLTSTFQSINASWELNEGYKEFNVSIKADGWDGTSNVTDQSSYTFNDLQAAVNYTITVITLSEKPKLESDPVVTSMHTKPVSPVLANATVLDHTAIKVTWEVPEQLKGDSKITYNVTVHSEYWQKYDTSHLTQNRFIIFNDLKSGTNYTFSVSVVAGNEESAPVFAYGMTVSNKKKVTFAVMCTSETSLYCSMNTTLAEIKEELENKLGNEYKDVYWKLEKIDRK